MEVPDKFEGCFATVPSQEIAKLKRNYDLSHFSKRTKELHVFAAHMMPGRKAMMTSRRVKQQSKEQENNDTALLRESFFCWTGVRQSCRSEVSLALWRMVRDGFQPQPPSIRLARKKTRTPDVAKTFDWDPSMVTQARAVVAHASCMSDNSLVDAIGKEFERNPLDKFVVSLAADAKPETLTPNLMPFIDSSIWRSTWKALVSLQWFSW